MAASPPPLPTDAELRVLRVLWDEGPAPVREVQACLNRVPDHDAGYTTVLKQLQIMLEKGLVRRDESRRAHVYHAVVDEQSAQRRLVGDLMERAFGGSAQKLVQRALSTDTVSAEDRAEIRALLDRLEASQGTADEQEGGAESSSAHSNEDPS